MSDRFDEMAERAWRYIEETDSGGYQISIIACAIREAVEAEREACAVACRAVYKAHKKTGSYPIDMGGLAKECEAAIRARKDPR